MIRLRLLGTLDLRASDGVQFDSLLRQPKRLALISYLAAARPPGLHRRDQLLDLFWPDLDGALARNALNQALRFLRQTLGPDVLMRRGDEEVGVDPDRLWCDVVEFRSALVHDRLEAALTLYAGDFLPGFFVQGGRGFEEWMDLERTALRVAAAHGARCLAEQLEAGGALTRAIAWGRRALELAPDDERALRRIVGLYERAGDRVGALRLCDAFSRRLDSEYGTEPSPETRALTARLRAGNGGTAAIPQPVSDPLPEHLADFAHRYRIECQIASGSMANVYLARDLKHDREVAVKVLRPEITEGIARDRFMREIRITSRLQHPNIVPLFDSGDASGWLYYVMPHVRGETLRERLARAGPMPVDEILHLLREIIGALAYAHEHGVVHRDVKPGNILLIDQRAVLTDFGIARAAETARTNSAAETPTLTQLGISLGTPDYMAPEQASGTPEVDHRTDLYAVGALAYEMLTGRPPFAGPTAQAVLAAHIAERPRPVTDIRPETPSWLATLVAQCLAKAPGERPQSAVEIAQALERRAVRRPGRSRRLADAARSGAAWTRRRPILAATAGWAIVSTLALLFLWPRNPSDASGEGSAVRRWPIVLADSAPLTFVGSAPLGIGRTGLAISPDGRRLAYVSKRGAASQLYSRELDQLEAVPLPGTQGAHQPFFSPDGQWIGFFSGRELRKVSVGGDLVISLAVVSNPTGATWSADGRILVADRQGYRLAWVPGEGGPIEPLKRDVRIRVFTPGFVGEDGSWILHGSADGLLYLYSLTSGTNLVVARDGVMRRDSVDLEKVLHGANPRFLPSGHITYFTPDGVLMAVPFDGILRRVLGQAVPVLRGVRQETGAPAEAQLVVSRGGTLIYAPGESAQIGRFVWVDLKTRRIDTLPLPAAAYGPFDLSPDDRRILVRLRSAAVRGELWVLDVSGQDRTRLQTLGILAPHPVWWPDGASVLHHEFGMDGGPPRITIRRNLADPTRLDTIPGLVLAVSPDGRQAVRIDRGAFWLSPTAGAGPDLRLTPSSGAMNFPVFSRDGLWLAYTDSDDATGDSETFVTPLEDMNRYYKISASGGEKPVWAADGSTLVYRNGQEWLRVSLRVEEGVHTGPATLLFRGPFSQVSGPSHDISRDGNRLLLILGPAAETTTRLVVVTNWFSELERLAPGKPR